MSKDDDDNPFPSQGARAGRSGDFLEQMLETCFKTFGVRCVEDNREYHYPAGLWERKEKFLIRQCRMRGFKVDYVYKDFARDLTVPIECKQQIGGGSTDQKLAYTVDELLKLETKHYWLVLNGQGFSAKVLHIIQNKVADAQRKQKIRGRLVYPDILYRAIEGLVERGEP